MQSTTSSEPASPRRNQGYAVAASALGWTLDAFDFFVVVFLVDTLAAHFQVHKSAIIWTLTATLATRPIGALLFGLFADRYGRRGPLMAVVIYFSIIELLSGLAPSYSAFFILRALYGIGMGGYWGVGASLAMESAPTRWRGILSGILQSGYSVGYLLAALAARLVLPAWGWRVMFWIGLVPAILTLYITSKAPESEAWKQHRVPTMRAIVQVVFMHGKSFAYLLLMLTLMTCLSHGTQDLYPDFLKSAHGISPAVVAYIAIFYNLGAVMGAILFGHFSETLGRRRTIIAALSLSLIMIPAWTFGASLATLAVGAFLMQVGVQGAWGIMPAHLNELSPDAVRSLFPGFVYQLGVLFGSPTNSIEYALRSKLGYPWAMTLFECVTIAALILVFALGSERKDKSFLRQPASDAHII